MIIHDNQERTLGQRSYITNNLDFQTVVQTEVYGIQTPYFQVVGRDGEPQPSMAILDWCETTTEVLVIASYDHYIEGFGPGTSEVALFINDTQRETSSLGTVFASKTETLVRLTTSLGELKVELQGRISDDIGGQTAFINHARLSIVKLIRN